MEQTLLSKYTHEADIHSVTAGLMGIDRNQAKLINMMIYQIIPDYQINK